MVPRPYILIFEDLRDHGTAHADTCFSHWRLPQVTLTYSNIVCIYSGGSVSLKYKIQHPIIILIGKAIIVWENRLLLRTVTLAIFS